MHLDDVLLHVLSFVAYVSECFFQPLKCDVKVLIIVLVTKHQTNVLVKIIRSFLCLSRLTTWQQNVELTDILILATSR